MKCPMYTSMVFVSLEGWSRMNEGRLLAQVSRWMCLMCLLVLGVCGRMGVGYEKRHRACVRLAHMRGPGAGDGHR